MGDLADDCRALTEARKERHAEWHSKNRAVINDSGIVFIDKHEALLFREKIKVDFYPSTGRWRYNNKTYSGGAIKFLTWLSKQ